MAVNATSIKLRFPEFKSYDDALIEFAIADAASSVDTSPTSPWGTDVNRALSYLAAHHLMVRIQRLESGTGQILASQTIGPISLTYAASRQPAADPSDLTTTDYGSYYLTLVARYFSGARII